MKTFKEIQQRLIQHETNFLVEEISLNESLKSEKKEHLRDYAMAMHDEALCMQVLRWVLK